MKAKVKVIKNPMCHLSYQKYSAYFWYDKFENNEFESDTCLTYKINCDSAAEVFNTFGNTNNYIIDSSIFQ